MAAGGGAEDKPGMDASIVIVVLVIPWVPEFLGVWLREGGI